MGKYIIFLSVVTVGMLIYVHQQISIIRFSYVINTNVERLTDLSETHKNLTFQIASVKSPTILEEKLAAADISLVYPREINVIKVPVAHSVPMYFVKNDTAPEKHNVLRMFGFGKVAQADE